MKRHFWQLSGGYMTKLLVAVLCVGGIFFPGSSVLAGPVTTLTAEQRNILAGSSATLHWDTTGITDCDATDSRGNSLWHGSKSVSGSETVEDIPGSTDFQLTCTGPDGTVSTKPGSPAGVFLDEDNNLLYVGSMVYDTHGNNDPSDDTLLRSFTTASTPALLSDVTADIVYDQVTHFLYIGSFNSDLLHSGGITVIDTHGNADPGDDTLVRTYTTSTTPRLISTYIRDLELDAAHGLLYVSSIGGVSVIDTKNNTNAGDDTLAITYTRSSSPSLSSDAPEQAFFDAVSNLLYVSTENGLTVIDTQGNTNPLDDLVVARYDMSTTPAIASNRVQSVFVDHAHDILYIANDENLTVINTQGTPYTSDDTLRGIYDTQTTPALKFSFVHGIFLDTATDLLYIATAQELTIIDTQGTASLSDDTHVAVYDGSYSGVWVDSTQNLAYAWGYTGLKIIDVQSTSSVATVSIHATPSPPSATLSVSPVTISSGGSVTLTWSSIDASSCLASDNHGGTYWSGSKATSGSEVITNITSQTTFELSCSNGAGTGVAVHDTTTSPPLPSAFVNDITLDFTHNLVYVSGNNGLTVFDTHGNADLEDDTLLMTYGTTSSPALAGNLIEQALYDATNHLLYVATDNGLTILDTHGNADPTDDTLLTTFATVTTPALAGDTVEHVGIDTTTHRLYISSSDGGLSVIDTHGNANPGDDTLVTTYTATSSPALSDQVTASLVDTAHNLLYTVSLGEIMVLNLTSETLVTTYGTASGPVHLPDSATGVFLDATHNLLYISTLGGEVVINTHGTIDPDDDTLVTTYTTISSPALPDDTVSSAFLDTAHHQVYMFTGMGVAVVDTQGTVDPSDDTLVKTYNTSSQPALTGDWVQVGELDAQHDLLYTSVFAGGFAVIDQSFVDTTAQAKASVSLTADIPPTVALSASPEVLNQGDSTVLTWSSTHATSCTASDNHGSVLWNGTVATSDSTTIPALTNSTVFTLSCTGAGGSAEMSVGVLMRSPHVNLEASSGSIVSGGSTTLTWSSTNAVSCVATDDQGGSLWSGSRALSGTQTVTGILSTTVFTLNCLGAGGPVVQNATVTVDSPVITFSAAPAQIATGGSTTLTWSTTSATSCTASDNQGDTLWHGAKSTSGAELVDTIPEQSIFTLLCTGPSGSNTASIEMLPSAPSITLAASAESVESGGNTTLTWSSTDATTCTASDDKKNTLWSGAKATSGSEVITNLSETTVFRLNCSGAGGVYEATIAIQQMSVTLVAEPSFIVAGDSTTLTWASVGATSCTASDDQGNVFWVGTKAISGSEVINGITSPMYVSLTCTGPGGTASKSTLITTLTFTATPSAVRWNQQTTLAWDAPHAIPDINCRLGSDQGGNISWAGLDNSNPGSFSSDVISPATIFSAQCIAQATSGGVTTTLNDDAPLRDYYNLSTPGRGDIFRHKTKGMAFDANRKLLYVAHRDITDSFLPASVAVVNTGELSPSDDAVSMVYDINSTPALPSGEINGISLSQDGTLLSIAMTTGLVVINTQGTVDPGDDVIAARYVDWRDSTSDPVEKLLQGSDVYSTVFDEEHHLIYVVTADLLFNSKSSISAINTHGTINGDDDTLEAVFSGASDIVQPNRFSPSVPKITLDASFFYSRMIAFDTTRHVLYAQSGSDLLAIDTHGDAAPANDSVLGSYSDLLWTGYAHSLAIDEVRGLVYVSQPSYLRVISTYNTVSTSDDTVYTSGLYSGEFIEEVTFDSTQSILYVGASSGVHDGLEAIDTKGNSDPSDDVFMENTGGQWGMNKYVGVEVVIDHDYGILYTFDKTTQDGSGTDDRVRVYTMHAETPTAYQTVTVYPEPIVSLSASPLTIGLGSSTTLTWSSSGVDTCTASDNHGSIYWSGSKATSGSEVVSGINANTTFTISCDGPGGADSASQNVTISPPTATLTLSPALIEPSGSTVLTWSSVNATACTASDNRGNTLWSGAKATTGVEIVNNIPTPTTFTLICTGPGGSVTKTATVQPMTISLIGSKGTVNTGESIMLTWTSTGTTACIASDDQGDVLWSGAKAVAGVESTQAIDENTRFTLVCTGPGGSVSSFFDVSLRVPVAVTATLTATPTTVNMGGESTLDWGSTGASNCNATNTQGLAAWQGSKNLSGSQAVSGISAATQFSLTCTGSGLNPGITTDPTDDTLITQYTSSGAPAIISNRVNSIAQNPAFNLLYIATGSGVSVINTHGTADASDDTLVTTYSEGNTPTLIGYGGTSGSSVVLDIPHNLVYIVTPFFGTSVIDTHGTISAADDTLAGRYNYITLPQLSTNHSTNKQVTNLVISPENHLVYISTWGGGADQGAVYTINTQGTTSTADDAIVATYNTTSNPALPSNDTKVEFIDSANNLLYISTPSGGLSVINTQGTISQADDTLVTTYSTTSTPALQGSYVLGAYFDAVNHLVYVSTMTPNSGVTDGLSVIDTHGTLSAADDTLVNTYSTISTPALPDNTIRGFFADTDRHLIYVSTDGGLAVIDTNNTVNATDDTLVTTYSTTSTPALPDNHAWTSAIVDPFAGILYIGILDQGVSVISLHSESATATADVAVQGSGVSLTANPASILAGESSTLDWASSGVDTCTASDDQGNVLWNGPKALSGTENISNILQTTQFTITCNRETPAFLNNYNTTSNPALPNNTVYKTTIDSAHHLVYFATYGGGVAVVNTQGTKDPGDDTLLGTYDTNTAPFISNDYVEDISLDESRHLIYISTDSGLDVIDTLGTLDMSDDARIMTYSTGSLPTLSSDYVITTQLDQVNNLLYVSTADSNTLEGRVDMINTQGTADPSDDTLEGTYSSSGPFILPGNYYILAIDFDRANHVVYLTTSAGLVAIDTHDTLDVSDDTLVTTYNFSSTPALPDDFVMSVFFDADHHLLYASTGLGLAVIDTQGTLNPNDDTLVTTYTTSSTPAIADNGVVNAFMDTLHHRIYVSTYFGVSIIDTQGTVSPSDDTLVTTYGVDSIPQLTGFSTYGAIQDAVNDILYISTYDGGVFVVEERGIVSDTATVTVTAPPPTVTLSADPVAIAPGGSSTLTWSSTNADTCGAADNQGNYLWSGDRALADSEMVNHILNTTTFTLTCTGPGGSVSDTVDVTVDFSLLMSLSLTANPTDIASGGSSTLDWTSSGVDVCTASDSQGNTLWSGAKNLVDSEQVQNILNTTTFTLNCHPTAETFLKAYTPTSSPPIANEIVNGSFLDSARNILYVSTDGGLSAINTQGTLNPSDDVLVMTYNLTSTPDIPDDQFDYVKQTFLDEPHNLLYISTFGGGLTVINTQGTVDPSDDVREMTYNLTSTPALPSEYTTGAFLDNARHLLYISTYGGLTVINTQDTVDPSDDTLVEVYDTNVMPLIDNWVNQSFLDTDHNLLYVSGYGGGLSVINTQGTVDPADDTFVTRYNTTSTPAIAGTFLQRTLLDTMHHLLYVATEGGLSVINTQNTIDPADDTLVTTYNASSTPALGGDVIQNVFLDVSHNHVYVLAEGGMYVINTQGTVSVADDTIDKTYGTPGLLPELHPNRVTMLDGTLDAAHNILYVATTRGLFAVGQSADISDTATVTVSGGGGPAPTVTLDANPTSIVEGSSSTLTWSTTDATSCTASDDQGSTLWSGAKATSGSEQVQNIPSTTVFQLSCTGPGGQASDTATVTAVPVTLSVVANPHTVNLGTLTATGRTTPTATTVTVATNNPAGYQLLWSASSAHLVHAQGAGHGTIQPLVPSTPGVPALWDSSASTTAWGAHLGAMSSVVDTDRWGSGDDYTNGKWLNVPTSPTELLRHTAATNGDTEYLYFGAEVGANVWQPSGTYTTDITLTAVTL